MLKKKQKIKKIPKDYNIKIAKEKGEAQKQKLLEINKTNKIN